MSVGLISFLGSIGFAGFIFAQLTRATGNSSVRQSVIVAVIAGILAYIVFYTLLKFVLGFK